MKSLKITLGLKQKYKEENAWNDTNEVYLQLWNLILESTMILKKKRERDV